MPLTLMPRRDQRYVRPALSEPLLPRVEGKPSGPPAEDETAIDAGMCFAIRVACESPDGLVLHGDTFVV